MVHWQWFLELPLQTPTVLRAHHLSSLKQRWGAQLSHQMVPGKQISISVPRKALSFNLQCEAGCAMWSSVYCLTPWSKRNQPKSEETKIFWNPFISRLPLRQVQIVSISWINVGQSQNCCNPVLDVGKSSGLWLAKSWYVLKITVHFYFSHATWK